MQIETVTVIGANGSMGCNISAIFASFGNAKVYMVARKLEDAQKAISRAAVSVKAESIAKNLIPVTYDDLSACIEKSDFVMESVVEDIEIKKLVYRIINNSIPQSAMIATGTSGLSIDALAEQLDIENRKRFFGVHFFNPPYNMPLCEFIASKYSDITVANVLVAYLENTLLRNVVRVRNTAAFLGNRIGFQFINLALQLAEKYQYSGGIDYIDAVLGGFTGRAMGPMVTSDFVGLDVHKAIVDNIFVNTYDYEHESFVMPQFAVTMINQNHLGRKTGIGLYQLIRRTESSKEVYVYDIETREYRPKRIYNFPFAEQMILHLKDGEYEEAIGALVSNHSQEAQICIEMLIRYALYGIFASQQIGEDIHSADKVMASGFNWIPPLCVYNAINAVIDFKLLAKQILTQTQKDAFDLDKTLYDIPMSNYDYRSFLKAKR